MPVVPWLVSLALVGLVALPAAAETAASEDPEASAAPTPTPDKATDKIHLRLHAKTLEDGDVVIHTFPSAGRLFARVSGQRILGYDAELTVYDPETGERRMLAFRHAGTREEVEEAPPGANEPRCVEWRERCYRQEAVLMQICDTVCTKVYDPETKEVVPVTDPEMIYLTMSREYGKFKREAHRPRPLQRKQRPAGDDVD